MQSHPTVNTYSYSITMGVRVEYLRITMRVIGHRQRKYMLILRLIRLVRIKVVIYVFLGTTVNILYREEKLMTFVYING